MGAMLTELEKHCAKSFLGSPLRRTHRNLDPRVLSVPCTKLMEQVNIASIYAYEFLINSSSYLRIVTFHILSGCFIKQECQLDDEVVVTSVFGDVTEIS